MKRAGNLAVEKGAIDLIEEAVHLLRNVPLVTAGVYLLGVAPFLLGLLYYWEDMCRSAYAYQHLAGGALGLGALFLWMKFCQSIFARHLMALVKGEPRPTFTGVQYARIFLAQAAIQPTGLFALPLALVITVPFGWVNAFYQNVCVLPDGNARTVSQVWSEAKTQMLLWPQQNHVLLGILSGFTVIVFLNWTILGFIFPGMLKMFFGIESIFTRSSISMLNSTFLMVAVALTYLSVDPIVKCVYALRCFYGASRRSGEDLKVDLRRVSQIARQAAIWLLVTVLLSASYGVAAPTPATRAASESIAPADLDRAVQQTLQQRKYAWRLPRQKPAENPKGLIARFLERISDLLHSWWKTLREWIEWIRRHWFPRKDRSEDPSGSGYGWIMALQVSLYVLAAAVAVGLGLFIYRAIRDRRRKEAPIASQPLAPTPDLADENVGAELLPEDGWTRLGRELLQRGEFRLALRAFYLASLAHLSERNLLTLTRYKSNRDYERELRRRAHALPAVLPIFTENVLTFDRVWYGNHEINQDLVAQFLARVESLKVGVP